MKVGFLITARMKSTRLPKKLTLEVNGRHIIRCMIDRLKLSQFVDDIIICTSTNPQDDILEEIAGEEGIKVFRGSEDDVIQRLYEASKYYNLDYVLNITADCPLVSFEYIDIILENYKDTEADLIRTQGLPHGLFLYGLKVDAMKKVCEVKDKNDTEVWGKYFTDTGLFHVLDIEIPENLKRPDYRLTLDYPEDYEFFKRVYTHFGNDTYRTSLYELIDYLDNHPEIVQVNKHCKGLYKERAEQQSRISLK